MAASLVNLFSGLCIQTRSAVVRLLSQPGNAVNTSVTSQRLYSALQGRLPHTTANESVTKRNLHTTPVCSTTPELKEWREHRVVDRFYRLPWGAWIRTQGGRRKGMYKRHPRRRWQLQQHIFCNYHQNKLLDKLVTQKWKEPKYFADSPYEPYSQRTNSYWQPTGKKFYP